MQLGYHFPGTAWEIAGRYSAYDSDRDAGFGGSALLGGGAVSEFAFGINYSDAGALIYDTYTGYPGNASAAFEDQLGMLFRLQWQLAL